MNFEGLNHQSQMIIEKYREIIKKWIKDDLSNVIYNKNYDQIYPEAIFSDSVFLGVRTTSEDNKTHFVPRNDGCLWVKNIHGNYEMYTGTNFGVWISPQILVEDLVILFLEKNNQFLLEEIIDYLEYKNYFVPIPEKIINLANGSLFIAQI